MNFDVGYEGGCWLRRGGEGWNVEGWEMESNRICVANFEWQQRIYMYYIHDMPFRIMLIYFFNISYPNVSKKYKTVVGGIQFICCRKYFIDPISKENIFFINPISKENMELSTLGLCLSK